MKDAMAFKHDAATLEATKGLLLFTCENCRSHQRSQPVGSGIPCPKKACFCGGENYSDSFKAVHILSLMGYLGLWEKFKSHCVAYFGLFLDAVKGRRE